MPSKGELWLGEMLQDPQFKDAYEVLGERLFETCGGAMLKPLAAFVDVKEQVDHALGWCKPIVMGLARLIDFGKHWRRGDEPPMLSEGD